MPGKVCDEITYPFPNFNSSTVEIWEWTNNLTTYYMTDVPLLIHGGIENNPC